ncbi:MAG: ABC transporter permease [Pseudomonadales bacterium]|nr:ABC transporter permease [Pseudomonadales bacterium]
MKKQTDNKNSSATKPARGASAVAMDWRALLRAWRQHHRDSAYDSLQRQRRAPLQYLLTSAVIGIALALPAMFILIISNVQHLGEEWNGTPRLSVFLQHDTEMQDATHLQKQLQQQDAVATVVLITPEQGLASFESSTHLSNTLALLDENPLPILLTVTLKPDATPETVQALQQQWQALPHIDNVQADYTWLKKLFHLIQLGQRMTVGLAVLLGVGALLTVGNTIRLAIENRRAEIIVAKLVGATDAFVRRPFLYSGLWFGLSGGVIAIALVALIYCRLLEPVAALTALYQSNFTLQGANVQNAVLLLLAGIALGMSGAQLAVGHHLRDMRPR